MYRVGDWESGGWQEEMNKTVRMTERIISRHRLTLTMCRAFAKLLQKAG